MRRNGYEYDEIADTIFAPIYPVIARQIKAKTGLAHGKCLDVGCGGGHLGLCMAAITKMDIVLLDKLPEALEIAKRRCEEWGFSKRVSTLLGDAQYLPVANNTCDLIISRGSIWFWEDVKRGIEEIYRILNPRGWIYIGGGYGSVELRIKIKEMLKTRDGGFQRQRIKENNSAKFTHIMHEIKLEKFEIIDDERGFWIVIQKPQALYYSYKRNNAVWMLNGNVQRSTIGESV